MPKQIPIEGEIFLAPDISGSFQNGLPVAIDNLTGMHLNPNRLEDKITIYEREVTEWFLKPALKLLDENSFLNSFIVLMVCLSYIEGVEQYKSGESSKNQSSKFFVKSLESIYQNRFSKKNLGELYIKARCGLFHNGMVRGGVIFSNEFPEVMRFDDNGKIIRINPSTLLSDLKDNFTLYISLLRSTNTSDEIQVLKSNFDKMYSVL